MLKEAALVCGFLMVGCSCVVVAGEYRLLQTRTETIEAQNLEGIHFDVGAGFLKVMGDPGTKEIRITADFRGRESFGSDEKSLLENLEFSHKVEGNRLEVRTRVHDRARGLIDLTLTVPEALELEIEDGSGSITVHEMARGLRIRDGSGSIELDRVGGDVRIHDGSGSIEATGIGGRLEIEDGSGAIVVRDVGADVDIRDSSGGIQVAQVAGNVVVRDSSGGIDVQDVEGDFRVLEDGSGSIHHSNVKGRVEIPKR